MAVVVHTAIENKASAAAERSFCASANTAGIKVMTKSGGWGMNGTWGTPTRAKSNSSWSPVLIASASPLEE